MMGILYFITFLLCEIGFMIWDWKKNKRHKIKRGYVALGFMVLFLFLMFIGVIRFEFRCYGVIFVLSIQSIIAIFRLISHYRRKHNLNNVEVDTTQKPKPVTKAALIGRVFGMAVIYMLACLPAIFFPQYELIKPSGSFHVQTALYSYTDHTRIDPYDKEGKNREVNIEFWYPENRDETCPLVVFSHGSNGIRTSNTSLFEELASNGYVVCSIDHPYHSFMTQNTSGKTTLISSEFSKEMQIGTLSEDKNEVYGIMKKWMDVRQGDINFIIDTIKMNVKNHNSDDVYQIIDIGKIAVTGHSLGGAAALGVGRTRDDIKAVVALESPYMADIKGVDQTTNTFIWEDSPYPVSTLNIYSDTCWDKFDSSPVYEENKKMLSNQVANTYNIHMENVGHLQLCDLGLISPILTNMLDPTSKVDADCRQALIDMNEKILEFLNENLR